MQTHAAITNLGQKGLEKLRQKACNSKREVLGHQWANKPKCKNITLPYCIWTVLDAMSKGNHMQTTITQHRHCVKQTCKLKMNLFMFCLHSTHCHFQFCLQPQYKQQNPSLKTSHILSVLGPQKVCNTLAQCQNMKCNRTIQTQHCS